VLLVLAFFATIIARGEVITVWPATARLYALLGLPAMPSGPGLELGEVIPARTSDGLIVEGDITNAGNTARAVPRLRVALRDPNEKEIQFKIIDPPTARLGPGVSAHFKTTFDNADETATVKVSFVHDSGALSWLRRAIRPQRFRRKRTKVVTHVSNTRQTNGMPRRV